VRCARCRTVWHAVAPAMVRALATMDDLDVVDIGPRIPDLDLPPREAEPSFRKAEAATLAGPASEWERSPEPEPVLQQSAAETAAPAPEAFSIDGINLAELSAELAAAQAEQHADSLLADMGTEEIAVAQGPSLVPHLEPHGPREPQPAATEADAGEDIETFAAKRAHRRAMRRRNSRWAVPGLPAILLALIAANTILVAWRMDIVRLLPQTASLYAAIGLSVNLRGIAFEDIKMSTEEQDGMTVLVIEGSVVNTISRAVEVPRLRLAVRNERQNEIYSWTTLPTRSILGPGETLPFRSRLASPPAETRDLLVRFFNRRDIVAGIR
jgi:hypothetical protein